MKEEEPEDKNFCIVILKFIGFYWRGFFLIIWPFLCGIVFVIDTDKKIRNLYVLVLMAGYWVTECIPLQVTGLFPLVLLPLLDVVGTKALCQEYFNNTNFLFLGSIFIASGIESSGLHKRIAYCTLMAIGVSPRRLHFGLCLVTSFLSFWLTNSAATAMMCPILTAILQELETQGIGTMYHPKKPDEENPRPTNITVGFFLSAAYASTIGGLATLVGTGTNITYKGLFERRFPDGDRIDFVPWMLFNVPPVILATLLLWFFIEVIFMGFLRPNSPESLIIKEGAKNVQAAKNVIIERQAELGKMQWQEIGVLILFIMCILLWFFRKPEFIPGYQSLYSVQVSDATPPVMIICLFCILPDTWAFFKQFCTKTKADRPKKTVGSLVLWKYMQEKMHWGFLFLLGGGFALAAAGKQSGLSAWLGQQLAIMKSLPPFGVLVITSFLACLATELTSNVAICNIIIPVLMELCVAMETHPVTVTYLACIACSCAFLMPVGTPPNAIAAGFINMKTTDMMKGGILVKLATWLIYIVLMPTYGLVFYKQAEFPDWAREENTTSAATTTPAAVTPFF